MDSYTKFLATMLLFRATCKVKNIENGSQEEVTLLRKTFEQVDIDMGNAIPLYTKFVQDSEVIQMIADVVAGVTKTEALYIRPIVVQEWLR